MARALIIEDSGTVRATLKQLAEHCGHFNEVDAARNFDDARVCVALGTIYSYIFISSSLDPSEAAQFVEDVRLFPGTAMSTIVAFGDKSDGTLDAVANGMLVGIHGFLFEAFTVERLNQIIEIAGKAQAQGTHLRLKAATGLILTEIMDNVSKSGDSGSKDAQREPEPKGDLWDRVQNSFDVYKQLTGDSIGTAVAINLQKIAPSKRVPEYRGVSKRVRSLLESKFKSQIKRLVRLGAGRQNKSPPAGHS